MPRITISYRRSDSAGITGRIFDRLADHYGAGSVFMDIDAIPLGVDFRRHIDGALKETDFLLVILGPRWLGPREDGTNRIGDATDPVRIEIETALRIGLKVIPVLVEGASMPAPSALPESMRDFPYLNGTEISAGRDFSVHIGRLIHFLDSVVEVPEAAAPTQAGPVPPTEPIQPQPAPPPRPQAPRGKTKTTLWIALGIVIVAWPIIAQLRAGTLASRSLSDALVVLFPILVVMIIVSYVASLRAVLSWGAITALTALWLLGIASGIGGLIHVLLALAAALLVWTLAGRRRSPSS